MNAPRDPLELPLSGVQVVEASAGTGKTWTIATLYLRAMLEQGLSPEQIVVATFARDAAAELSSRLRERVHLAAQVLSNANPEQPCVDDSAEIAITRRSITRARERCGVALAEQQRRMREADLAMDTAIIGTLHAFCARLLGEFGFETGAPAGAPELLEDLDALNAEIVDDFWRAHANDREAAALLAGIWHTPRALMWQVCDPRWRGREPVIAQPDSDILKMECARVRALIAAWDEPVFKAAEAELKDCFGHPSARASRMKALRALQAWACAQADEESDASAASAAESFLPEQERKPTTFIRHSQGEIFELARTLCAVLRDLRRARERQAEAPASQLLYKARQYHAAELPRRLQALGKTGYDQLVEAVARALDDPARGGQLRAKISARWPCALIDEFQDTDPQQWRILQTLFARNALVLVGDPKQAIYGFRGGDVHAYLAARDASPGEPLRLLESQRAGQGVCAAINALFASKNPFVEPRIEYTPVRAAGRVRETALLINGEAAPALQLWRLPPSGKTTSKGAACPWSKAEAREQIESACVARIVELLQGAQRESVHFRDGDGETRPLRAGDIAVLVNDNREAHSMQRALGRAGVAASCRLRVSVYASEEALDVLRVLEALRDPADAPRARAAQAGLLVGADALAIGRSARDAEALDALLQRNAECAARVQRHGVLAFLHELIAAAAPRLLALADGRRRVANYLQLAELAQQAWLRCFGVEDLCEQLARRIADAGNAESDTEAEAARLRLESDAQAVQIATVHAAKGLEYGVVFLPYAGFGKQSRPNGKPALTWYHDGEAARVAIGRALPDEVASAAQREAHAEEVRKLYVAVTRARAACVLPWGWINQGELSALHGLLHRDEFAFDDDGCAKALHVLHTRAPGAIAVDELPRDGHARLTPAGSEAPVLRAAEMAHAVERDWRTWSFSRLVRGESRGNESDPGPGNGDTLVPASDASLHMSVPLPVFCYVPFLESGVPPPRTTVAVLAGARFGTAVHAALERADFDAWRDVGEAPETQRDLIVRSLRAQGLPEPGTVSLERAVDQVGYCMRNALNAPLACGARLCDVQPERRRAEMEFHLRLAPSRVDALFALLHAHGYQTGRNGFGVAHLHGLLTGVMDLVFEHGGRYHLVDYKTNLLPTYDVEALREAVAAHDYDLQYLLYVLALHRWLRQVLPGYDYDTHIGDVYYLFVRDVNDGCGVHRDRPPRELIEAMDALFDAREELAA
ncbi:MAG TPA: UvrD-helicase domain-containing protein [Rhodanobacteraceae bacterium]|nr:UvrD-helicase domain-containing protein [Rhodanobacteraceae bacterium]